jgi:tetratricopeptide (TPR) repeat protein/TolB-like protein
VSTRAAIISETGPDSGAVQRELERIATSNNFRKAERCVRLLRHLTVATLEGRSDELKEYSLGTTVFGRPAAFDPGVDAVVRLEARRLRLKLAEYYQEEGLQDPVIIDIPKGRYVPDFRFRHAAEIQTTDVVAEPAVATARPGKLRFLLPVASAIAIVAAAGWFLLRKQPVPVQAPPAIAVVGFRNLSPHEESSWISGAVSELMNIDLGSEQRLRALPLDNVMRMRTELAVAPQTDYPAVTLRRIRANLGSDYVVAGSYEVKEQQVRLDLMLFDTRSGRQIAAIGENGAEDTLTQLIARCAQRVQAQLGMRLPPAGGPEFPDGAMEPYSRGMEAMRKGDALSAKPYLQKAAAEAPSNPLVHAGLAAVWSNLGLDTQAGKEAKIAFESSAELGRVEQLEIEGQYQTIVHDSARAIQVYEALFTLLPDDLEYGLLLAHAQAQGGRAQEAMSTIASLRRLPLPLGGDPRIDLAEARAAGALADFARTRRLAHSAADKAKARGARLLYARARLLEAGAMQNLEAPGFADVRAEARGICSELGDSACVMAAYRIEANAMIALGNVVTARALYGSVLEIAQHMGNALELLNGYSGMGAAARLQGDLPEAETNWRAALALGTEMGAQKSYPAALDLAEVLAQEGHIAEARKLIERSLEGAREMGDREGVAMGQAALADTLAMGGQSSAALVKYGEAIRLLREANLPYELAETLLAEGNTQMANGDVAGARQSFEESRATARQLPVRQSPEIDLAFARLSFAQGQGGDAVSHARAALDGFTRNGRVADEFAAAAILARALVAQRNFSEAAQVLARLPSPDEKKFPAESVMPFQIARCFVLANTGRRDEALRTMDAIAANATRSGIPKLESEAQQARKAL